MQIATLMHTTVVTCRTVDTLDHAAHLMWERDLGWLPVIDDAGRVAGVITDRDICMGAYTRGTALRSIPVAATMTAHVHACRTTDHLQTVAQTMRARQVRRMPVLDDDGRLVGIVSFSDLARAAAHGELPADEVTRTLAQITTPRELVERP